MAVALPPGPTSHPAVQTFNWLFRPIDFMDSCRRRYGDAFSVTFLGFQTPMVMVSHPDAVRDLYRNRENGLPPGRTLSLEPVLGPRSVLLLEGSEHLARRKLMLPPFHGERMRAYETVIEEIVTREIDSWPLGERFAIHPRMQAVTLDVILRAVFGVSDPARAERLRDLLRGLLSDTSSPLIQLRFMLARRFGRGDPFAEVRARNEMIDGLLFEEVAERRADPELEEREDILSMLVAARFEDGEPMSDAEIRDQLMTLLLAGHETTATALAWTFDLLLRNPDKLARLKAELEAGDEAYLKATITEALRLRPVIPLAGRRLGTELEVNGHTLPAGTDVTPAIWLTHTREDLYPAPHAFRPERFLDGGPDTYGWIPFGGGVRRCLGAAFAEFEMRVVLREAIKRCELRGALKRPEKIARRNITFSPRRGTPVIVDRRAPQATAVRAAELQAA
jgi:cytochrome P450 family 135